MAVALAMALARTQISMIPGLHSLASMDILMDTSIEYWLWLWLWQQKQKNYLQN